MSCIPGAAPVAFRFRMSTLRAEEGVEGAGPVGVCRVWMPDFGDCGDDFPGHTDAITSVVSRHVVGDDAEERRQRAGTATSARTEEV
jgi:hypothetical protein